MEDFVLLKAVLRGSNGFDTIDPHLLAELQRKLDKIYESPIRWIQAYLTDYVKRLRDKCESFGDEYSNIYTPSMVSELEEFIDLISDFKELEDDNDA